MSVVVVDAPAGGWAHPWPAAVELARELPADRWVLVGGLMVQLHAAAHGVTATRPTDDLDVLLDVRTHATALSDTLAALHRLGYTAQPPAGVKDPAHRFRRGEEIVDVAVDRDVVQDEHVVDVLVPDHLPLSSRPRMMSRPVMAIDGGFQALERTVVVEIDPADGYGPVRIALPNLLAALVLKGAAFLVDSRDRGRHLRDGAVLAALIVDHRLVRAQLKGSDRKRIAALAGPDDLGDPYHPAWLLLGEPLATRGRDTLRLLLLP